MASKSDGGGGDGEIRDLARRLLGRLLEAALEGNEERVLEALPLRDERLLLVHHLKSEGILSASRACELLGISARTASRRDPDLQRILNEEAICELRRRDEERSLREIGDKVGVPKSTVRRVLERRGLSTSPPRPSREEEDE